MIDLNKIQTLLNREQQDGWLLYNFHNLDPCANSILKISTEAVLTRRWFYLIPTNGNPIKLVHKIESSALDHLPGKKLQYATWRELHGQLAKMLDPVQNISMQYSPQNAIPYVSYIDGGTLELIRSLGKQVHSSANLIQHLDAVWSQEGLNSHEKAAAKLWQIVDASFSYVRDLYHKQQQISEYQLQQFIVQRFQNLSLTYDHPPIVAVNEHSGNPHYEPTATSHAIIQQGDLLLIDLWAKEQGTDSIYADITWVGVVSDTVNQQYAAVFAIVKQARDAAVQCIKDHLQAGQDIHGYEVDDAARNVIVQAGYGDYFIHRTGHSIGREVHGKGVNMDNFETRDERKLIDDIGFSIEPGIYLPSFGIRSEIDVFIHNGQARISTLPVQEEIVPILAYRPA